MITRIYIDTSVIGGCFDEEFKSFSDAFFEKAKKGRLILLLSDILAFELEKAPPPVKGKFKEILAERYEPVALTMDAVELAQKYINEQAVAQRSISDARHIALATISHADVLVSWNFKHIVNYRRIHLFNSVNIKYGYGTIDIRSPKEIVYE